MDDAKVRTDAILIIHDLLTPPLIQPPTCALRDNPISPPRRAKSRPHYASKISLDRLCSGFH